MLCYAQLLAQSLHNALKHRHHPHHLHPNPHCILTLLHLQADSDFVCAECGNTHITPRGAQTASIQLQVLDKTFILPTEPRFWASAMNMRVDAICAAYQAGNGYAALARLIEDHLPSSRHEVRRCIVHTTLAPSLLHLLSGSKTSTFVPQALNLTPHDNPFHLVLTGHSPCAAAQTGGRHLGCSQLYACPCPPPCLVCMGAL